MFKYCALAASIFTLAACGDNVGEQAVAGGAVGAAGALVVDEDPGKGAIVGAAGNIIYCQANPGRC